MKTIYNLLLFGLIFAAGFTAAWFVKAEKPGKPAVEFADIHAGEAVDEHGHAKSVHAEGENTVKISPQSQEAAGFKYETAKRSTFAGVIGATGQINSDSVVSAHVIPGESGILEKCGVLPGEKVEKGQLLCVMAVKNGTLEVVSPISGTVISSSAVLGAKIDKITSLHTVADLAKLNAVFNVNEKDIHDVRIGQRVKVMNYDQGSGEFDGRVTFVSPSVDSETGTVKVGVSVNNPQGRLKLGMFVKAEFEVEKQGSYIVIPQEAAQYSGGKKIAFVKTGGGEFEIRELTVAGERPGVIAVSSGIQAGEVIVAGGGFLLKSEYFKSKMGAGCAD